jgi:CBS domain containing-hemolysin-like protein
VADRPIDNDDPDISIDVREAPANGGGRSFWGGLRAALFGEGEESTLRDQIEEAIDESEDEAPKLGDLTLVERQMLRNMLHFGEKTAGDVAVPRGDIIAVESRISFAELVAAFADAGHSRLPVYEDSLDKVVGMIHLKDVFARMVAGEDPPEDIMTLVREPLYVPESMGMPDLLASMRAQRIHLAIVVDEFGGTEGLVTIEDVVEEITGEIEDEHDEEQEGTLIPIEGGGWDADARAELDEVAQIVDPRLAEVEEDVDTLGGLAVVLAGHVPQQGEVVEHPSGWRLEVTECEPRRVTRLRLHPPEDMETVG